MNRQSTPKINCLS